MLDALVRNSLVRSTALAVSIAAAPAYAESPSPSSDSRAEYTLDEVTPEPEENSGAYYLDPAKRRKKEERKAATTPPTTPTYQPATKPIPQYVQPAPPEEKKASKGGAWAALIGGSIVILLGTQLESQICETDYRSGRSGECKTDRSLMYLTMGGGALLAGLGLIGVLGK